MKMHPRLPRPLAASALLLIASQLPQLAFAQWSGSGTTQNPFILSDGGSASMPNTTTTTVTYIQNGGTVTGSFCILAYSDNASVGSSARYTLNGGTFALNDLTLATDGTPTDAWFTQNGGSASVNSLYISSSGSRYVLAGGTLTARRVYYDALSGPGIISLQGGTLVTSALGTTGGNWVGRLSFDGGTLKADAGVASPGFGWINSGLTVTVATGGAFIDTNGTNREIYAALPHDSGLGAALDGGLTKLGEGTLSLFNTLSYTGTTTVQAGTLQLSGFSSGILTGGGAVAVNGGTLALGGFNESVGSLSGTGGTVNLNGKNLTLNQTVASAYAGSITSAGTLTKTGAATLTLSGASTFSGGTTVNAGLVEFSAVNNFGTGNITLNGGGLRWATGSTTDISARLNALGSNGGVFDTNGNTPTLASPLTGTGGFTKIGAGTLKLTGASTYSGATLINGGLVEFSAANNFGTGNITLNGGGLRWAAGTTTDISFRLTAYGAGGATFDTNGNNVTLATPHSGGGITKTGAGILTLNSANNFTGGTTVTGGTLKLDFGGSTGTIRGALTINSGATVETSAVDAFGFITSAKVDSVTVNGGTLNNTAAGNSGWGVAYSLSNGALLTSNGGVSSASSLSAFAFGGPTGGNTSVNVTTGVNTIAGHVDLRGDNGNASGVNFTVASGATLNVTAGISSHDGAAVGPVGITKLGTGTMTLTGANTYTGLTTISAGTLQVGNGTTTGSLAGNIKNDAALIFNQATGNSTYSGVISGTGTLTKTGPGNLFLTGTSTFNGGTTVNGGVITLNGAVSTTGLIGAGGSGPSSLNQITINSGNINLQTDNAVAGTTPALTTALRINQGGLLSTESNTTKLPVTTLDGGVIETASVGNSTIGNYIFTNGLLTAGTGKTSHIFGGYIALPTAVTVGTGDTLRIGSTILGANALTKNGPGSLVLTAPNNHSGGTSINAGTVQIGDGGTSGSVAGNITNSSVLVFDRSDAFTHSGVISGSGVLIKNGTGTLTLSGANTYTGGTTLNAGILKRTAFTGFAANTPYIVNGGTLDLGYEFTMSSLSGVGGTVGIRDGTFTLNQSVNTTYGGTIASTDTVGNPTSFIKTGTGTLTLTGANPAAPRTTILSGGIVLNGGTMTPSGAFYVGVGAASSATLTVQNGGVLTTASSGVGTSSSNNHATVTGTGSVWNTGGLIVGEIGSGNTLLIQNGGSVALTSSCTIGSQSGDYGNSVTVDGAGSQLTTPTAITIGNRGDGTLTVQNGGAISASFLRIGFQSGGSGMLHIGSSDLAQPTSGGTVSATSIVFGGGTGSINFNQNDVTTLSASISGIGSVNQRGTGTTILTGASTMIGLTTLSAGTLLVNGSVASNVKAESGATLGGSGSISGFATIETGAILSPGNSPGTLTFTNGLTLSSGSLLSFELGTMSDLVRVSGGSLFGPTSGQITLNLSASAGFGEGAYPLFEFFGATPVSFDTADFAFGNTVPGYDYSLEQNGSVMELQVVAIPEPSTAILLFGSFIFGFGFHRRRRFID